MVASWQRDRLTPGTTTHSATYFLDVLAWFLTVGGAVFEVKVDDLLMNAGQRAARRRAMLFAVVGFGAALTACITIPGRADAVLQESARAVLSGFLVSAIGLGLGGAGALIWFHGSRYAADRVAKMGEEDW